MEMDRRTQPWGLTAAGVWTVERIFFYNLSPKKFKNFWKERAKQHKVWRLMRGQNLEFSTAPFNQKYLNEMLQLRQRRRQGTRPSWRKELSGSWDPCRQEDSESLCLVPVRLERCRADTHHSGVGCFRKKT